MKRMPFIVLAAAAIFAAIIAMGCGASISVTQFEQPPLNGEVVFFQVGEEKYFSDGQAFIVVWYHDEGNFECSDTVSGHACDNFHDIVGVIDPNNINSIHLRGEWREIGRDELPFAPPTPERMEGNSL